MIKSLLVLLVALLTLVSNAFTQPCQISQITVTPLACNELTFMATVNMQVSNPSSPGFTLAGNGVIYGTWLYSELPVTIGPLFGDNASTYELIAWDVTNPDCQSFTTFPAANCGPVCDFSHFTMKKISCVTTNIAAVEIDFDHANTSGLTWDLYYANGTQVGSYLYSSLPVVILNFTASGANPITVKVCDHTSETCCETFTVPAIDCNPSNCEFYNVVVDPECLSSNFVVNIDFDVAHPASDSFTIHGNSINYGAFGYNELPIILGPLNGSSNLNWDFIIQDKATPTCSYDYLLGVYKCPPPCDVLNFEATPLECNGNDAFQLQLDIDIEGEGDQGYSVFSNNFYYGTHDYDDLPFTIPAFKLSGPIDQVTVCDNENPGCCASYGFEALQCNGCIIYNLEANPLPCNNQGQFFISLNFDHQNTSSQGFSITGNMGSLGNHAYDDLPILLGPFPGNGSQFFEFVVTDLENEFCFDATELGTLPCSAICQFSNIEATPGECTANNAYILHLDFDHTGSTSTGFKVYANGNYFDTYNYSELPLTILEFPSNGNGTDVVQVCDLSNSNCCTSISYSSPNCQCSIFDISVANLSCTSDSTYRISVEFLNENLLDHSVDVSLDGLLLGTFDISTIPFFIDNVPEGTGGSILTICGHSENDCCSDIFIQRENCEGPQCNIWDLNAIPKNCSSDSAYTINIFFNNANLPSDSVTISANGEYIGKFKIQPDFIRILNFPQFDDPTTVITVCAVGNDQCCDVFSFETPDCTPNDCEVSGLVATPGTCASDTTYELVIEYLTENFVSDSVILTANGNILDTIFDPDHHIVVSDFPVYLTPETFITICSFDTPDCCDSYTFTTPVCIGTEVCHIFNLSAEAGDCSVDSTYNLSVNFQFDHLSIDSVDISSNGTLLGRFHVHEGHISIPDLHVPTMLQTVISVCATGLPDCCAEVTFNTPQCFGPGDCDISDLQMHIGDCQSDTTYALFVDFLYHDLPVDSVVISVNGDFEKSFAVHNGHIIINDLHTSIGDPISVSVCALHSPNCCEEGMYNTPDCTGGGSCHLYDLTATPGACSSDLTYELNIHFWWNNLPTDSVLIYANNLFIGTFHTDPDNITIHDFPIVGGETTTLQVCSLGAPECCTETTYNNPPCGANECSIFDISVQTFDCNSDTTFGAIINFQYQNVTAGGFDIYTGDQYLGFFNFDQVPVIANHFPANATGEYVITICEDDNFDCCTSFEFEGPVCAEGACDISNLEYSLTNCDSAGNFFFVLNFQHHNSGDSGFNVVGNNNIYGNFDFEQLPIEIGPFPTDNTSFEFLVTDADNQACFDFIEPGVVHCTVGTITIDKDEIFQVLNNGTTPAIFIKKNASISLFNANGKILKRKARMFENSLFEINSLPAGVYFAFLSYQGNTWPVKLVKS